VNNSGKRLTSRVPADNLLSQLFWAPQKDSLFNPDDLRMKQSWQAILLLLALLTSQQVSLAQANYRSFTVSTYAIQSTVQAMMNGDLDPAQSWAKLTRNLKIDKIYIEVMRNHTLVDEAGVERLKEFFEHQGVQVCGGLAFSISERNGYQGFDYADP